MMSTSELKKKKADEFMETNDLFKIKPSNTLADIDSYIFI